MASQVSHVFSTVDSCLSPTHGTLGRIRVHNAMDVGNVIQNLDADNYRAMRPGSLRVESTFISNMAGKH